MILSLYIGIDPLWKKHILTGNISKYQDLSHGGCQRKCFKARAAKTGHSVLFPFLVVKACNQYELFHNIWECKYIFLNKIKTYTDFIFQAFGISQAQSFLFLSFLSF